MTTRTSTNRRTFLLAAALGAGSLLASPGVGADADVDDDEPEQKLEVLFLGGTGFIGPHIVHRLVERGHEVTLFNRGNRDEMFPDLELITGNRIIDVEPGLAPLAAEIEKGRRWDVVIDTANVHTWTDTSAELLEDAADRYAYVSSMSVYADNSVAGQDETGALATMPDEEADEIDRLPYDMAFFGAVKARSEQAAERHFPGRTTIIRPGLIVGPRDFSHRFTYWPWRVREGGEVLAPGEPDHRVMFIDVRDLANFLVKLLEDGRTGIYNVNGPASGEMTIGKLLEACKAATGSDATFTWADADWLAARGVGAWMQMPVWIPPREGMEGFHAKSVEKAVAAGLVTRPVRETILDTLEWLDKEFIPAVRERGGDYTPGERAPGITPEREAELLAELKEAGQEQAQGENG